jgi:hypothetical protein
LAGTGPDARVRGWRAASVADQPRIAKLERQALVELITELDHLLQSERLTQEAARLASEGGKIGRAAWNKKRKAEVRPGSTKRVVPAEIVRKGIEAHGHGGN